MDCISGGGKACIPVVASPEAAHHHHACQHNRSFSTADEFDDGEKRDKQNSTSQAPNTDLIKALKLAVERNIRDYGEKHPTSVQLQIKLGNVYFRQGNLVGAASAYKQAVEMCDAPGEPLSTAYLNLGTVYWRSGEIPFAIQCLQQALQVNEMGFCGQKDHTSTTVASAFHQLGICYSLSNDWTNALYSLERARSIRSRVSGGAVSVAQTMDAIGKVHFMQGQFDVAMTCHEQALILLHTAGVTDTAATLQNMANVHVGASMPDVALAVLEQVRKVQNTVGIGTAAKAALHRQTLLMMADLYDETGCPEQASQQRREASALHGSSGL